MDEIYNAIGVNTNIRVVDTITGYDVYGWVNHLNSWYNYGKPNQNLSETLKSIKELRDTVKQYYTSYLYPDKVTAQKRATRLSAIDGNKYTVRTCIIDYNSMYYFDNSAECVPDYVIEADTAITAAGVVKFLSSASKKGNTND